MKKYLITLIMILFGMSASANDVWTNDMRNLFLKNNAIIYTINIRTFNAKDTNANGIIDEGEESGNFLNAIDRLDELQSMGINTINVLPVMEIGKKHAYGTAGSLYAAKSFNSLNPQLKNKNSKLSLEEQAKKFIQEAHKRGIRVIIDMPGCGSYDLSLSNPELFLQDSSGNVITPQGWRDIRLLDGGTEININRNVYNLYKSFVDYVMLLGADGIRVDVASSKPAVFWRELIEYSRKKDSQFMWLAESYTLDTESIAKESIFTPFNKLLIAGFDGYYDGYPSIIEWKKAYQLMDNVKFTNSFNTRYGEPKAVLGSFTTHDEISPILINGIEYSKMILWLNTTLKVNPFYVDGFATGDTYLFPLANKKATSSMTDDYTYYTKKGKIDLFNFSRKPEGKYTEFKDEFSRANHFRKLIAPLITYGKYTELKTSNECVFAYGISYNQKTVLVFGNLNFNIGKKASVKVPNSRIDMMIIPIKAEEVAKIENGKFNLRLKAGEIQVYLINNFTL